MLRSHLLLVILLLLTSPARAANKAVILRGGTYSGGEYAGITIDTAEPVIIEEMTLRGEGTLIASHYRRANVIIRNVRGYGPEGGRAGRFVSLEGFVNARIENCHLERTRGIYLLDYAGDRSERQTVRILRNRARNIDGRRGDGKVDLVQFAQLDKVRHLPGIEIAWNEVINEPGQSAVEDVISIYLSSGTAESPLKIHDNFIRGAYPLNPQTGSYSGGGIMLGDGVAKDGAAGDPAFVHAFENQVLDTTNYGIAISAGHDCHAYRNRVVSAGVLPEGKRIAAQNVGIYVWDSYKAGKDRFHDNAGRENVAGWVKGDARNDWWRPHAHAWEANLNWPGEITLQVYELEWQRWQGKLQANSISVGAQPSPPVR